MPDILITPNRSGAGNPNIQFSGSNLNNIRMEVLPEGQVAFLGKTGSLLTVTDSLQGSLMAVSDISGLPILEVFSDDRVVMGKFNSNALVVSGSSVGIRKTNPGGALEVSGSLIVTGSIDSYGIIYARGVTGVSNARVQIQNWGVEQSGNDLVYAYSGGEVIRFTSNGAIGINKTSTSAKLDVNGNVVITGSLYITGAVGGPGGTTLIESLRSNRNVSGGGTITVDGSGYVYWSSRFIIISAGRGSNFTTSGYFDMTCPTSGTITGVGGASNKTATAAGIPLGAWEALYYILPIGSGSPTVDANYRVAFYSSDIDIPAEWVLICVRNGDNGLFYFPNGIVLGLSDSSFGGQQSKTSVNNAVVKRDASGNFNANSISLTGSVTASAVMVSKLSGLSTITFPAGSSDAGYIQHDESSANTGIMRFSVGDDDVTTDYFSFGNTSAGFVERFRVAANGKVSMNNSMWHASLDGAARFYFTTNGRTYYGSMAGYEWRSAADVTLAYLSDTGNLSIGNLVSPNARLDVSGSAVVSGSITSTSNILDSKGNVRSVVQNSQSTTYTLVSSDAGKHVYTNSGITVATTTAFSIGDACTLINNTTSSFTVTQGSSVVLRQAGTSVTGSRTLGSYGLATVLCVASNTYYISGAGLS